MESLFQQISFGQWLILFIKTWYYILKIHIFCHSLISMCLCLRWSHFLFSWNSLRLSHRSALSFSLFLSFHATVKKIKRKWKQQTDVRTQLIGPNNTYLIIYFIYKTRNIQLSTSFLRFWTWQIAMWMQSKSHWGIGNMRDLVHNRLVGQEEMDT